MIRKALKRGVIIITGSGGGGLQHTTECNKKWQWQTVRCLCTVLAFYHSFIQCIYSYLHLLYRQFFYRLYLPIHDVYVAKHILGFQACGWRSNSKELCLIVPPLALTVALPLSSAEGQTDLTFITSPQTHSLPLGLLHIMICT